MPRNSEPQELQQEWQQFANEIFEEAFEQATINAVEQFYQHVLKVNLDSTEYVSNLPEDARDSMAEMAASIYADQAERILDSEYVGKEEVEVAVAEALLDDRRQIKVGAQAQGMVDMYYDQMEQSGQSFDIDQYQEWVFEALTNPWPPHHFEDNWESVERFKPPEEDPTYF